MKKIKGLMLFALLAGPIFAPAASAKSGDIQFQTPGGHTFKLLLQNVNGTQLYSLREGKGFPALESVVYQSPREKFQASVGAAAELGESRAVPFAGANWRLSERFFDTANNALLFGLAAAKHVRPEVEYKSWRGVEITLKASVPLW